VLVGQEAADQETASTGQGRLRRGTASGLVAEPQESQVRARLPTQSVASLLDQKQYLQSSQLPQPPAQLPTVA